MWRVTALIRQRADVSQDTFTRTWLDVVAPAIGAKAQGDSRVRRVIVNVAPESLPDTLRDVFPPAFDGLIEFWFDTAEDAVSAMREIGADADLRALAEPIIDGAKGAAWLAKVVPSKLEQGSTVKFLAGGDVAEGVALEDAHRYWAEEHPRVAQTAPDVWSRLMRYTQFHGKPEPKLDIGEWLAKARFVPLCSDMGFSRIDEFLKLYSCDQYTRIVRPDEIKFSRPGEALSFISREERVLADNAAG